MKFKIHVERSGNGMTVEDSFTVRGDTIEECQQQAAAWLRERGLENAESWSEEIN